MNYNNDEKTNKTEPSKNHDVSMQQNRSTKLPRFTNRKKYFIIISTSLLILAIMTPLTIRFIHAQQYRSLENLMTHVDHDNIHRIESRLSLIPDDYREVVTIKKNYDLIRTEATILEDKIIRLDYDVMREAYYNLKALDETLTDWNLSPYLSAIDNRILLYGITWQNDDYLFELIPNPDIIHEDLLTSTVPSHRIDGVEYCFEADHNYTLFRYVNENDPNDTFEAYEIVAIEENALTLLVLINGETITLYP